uniref:TOG domain-containing protein n=1 Tax=Lotharella globosa TaxID=91324 RepID=A0A7S3Z7P2_9EUKA
MGVRELLDKARTHHDPDIRFMAIRELIKLLDGMETIDSNLQQPVRSSLLQLLKDSNSDVQTNAVKLLGTVVRKIENKQVIALVSGLVVALVEDKTKDKKKLQLQREQFQTAIKKSVKELRVDDGKEAGGQMVEILTKHLISREVSLQLICMDLLKDIVSRFGKDVGLHHKVLLSRLQDKLANNEVEDIPIRAANTLGALARFLNDDLFKSLMNFLMTKIEQKTGDNVTYINAVGVVSREVGFRVGEYLEKLMPLLQKCCSVKVLREQVDTEDEKKMGIRVRLWEACLLAFESFLRGCPDKMTKYTSDLLELFVEAMKYDPNLTGDDEENGEPMEAEDNWGDGDGGDDDWGAEDGGDGWGDAGDGLVDENDISWKIRQQATVCVSAFIEKKSAVLKDKYPKSENDSRYCDAIAEFLEQRLGERDETVRLKVLTTLNSLVRQSVLYEWGSDVPDQVDEKKSGPPPLVRQKSWEVYNITTLPSTLLKQFKGASNQIKCALLDCLKEICVALQAYKPEESGEPKLVRRKSSYKYEFKDAEQEWKDSLEHVIDGIGSSDAELPLKTLDYLQTLSSVAKDPELFKNFIAKLVDAVGKAALDKKDRIKLHALRAAGALTSCVDKNDTKSAGALFSATFAALKLRDVDDEVKKAALAAIAKVIPQLSEALGGQQNDILPTLMERLKNTSTQLPALRTLRILAKSGSVDLMPSVISVADTLTTFMATQTSKPVKYESVRVLIEIVQKHGSNGSKFLPSLLKGATSHISEEDTHLCGLVLDLVGHIVESPDSKTLPKAVSESVIQKMLLFAQSPLVDSQSLTSLVQCFRSVSKSLSSFKSLLPRLEGLVNPKLPAHNVAVVAKCIASMAVAAPGAARTDYIKKALNEVKKDKEHMQQLALLSLGGIGKELDLKSESNLFDTILKSFQSESQSVKYSASFALGNITAGNLGNYIGKLLKLLDTHAEYTYLLLRAVREVVGCYYDRQAQIAPFSPEIFKALVAHTDSKEDAVRGEVAECLGGLARIEPKKTLQFLEQSLESKAAFTRSVAVGALRYAIEPKTEKVIASKLGKFLRMMRDDELEVRRQAVLSFTALLKGTQLMNSSENSTIMRDVVVPVLYTECRPNEKYIRIIDAGQIKFREDDHLPLRSAAFEALGTVVDVCPYRLNMKDFYEFTMQGVLDTDENIVLGTWEMYFRISQNPDLQASMKELAGGSSRDKIEGKTLPMDKILMKFVMKKMSKVKETNASREKDQARECLKKALLTVFKMLKTPGMDQCKDFVHLVDRVKNTKSIGTEVREALKMLQQLE